ncbi:hypothetical protein M407DRAFT_205708 [Tulasnella calospora MUT 4182]|uniref:methylisocitrate lyase n=1 Tax=Tulasnella calospora MUT 4182 TaxID=1051891 RepID=A0A0C3K2T5_9AGAM|nr:hypothetical protein M407DRAFT_205708 [Tulasnella calospora MUT 4182]
MSGTINLWVLLEKHAKNGTPSHTYGALDPVQVTQMATYLETVSVSDWQSSSTASSTNELGPDLRTTLTIPFPTRSSFYSRRSASGKKLVTM